MRKYFLIILFAILTLIQLKAQNLDWAIGYGQGTATSCVVDGNGNVYTVGYFNTSCDFDPGPSSNTLTNNGGYDIFILKTDSIGNFVWCKSMGGSSNDYGNSVTDDGSGNILVAGYFQGTVDFDPGPTVNNFTSNGGDDAFFLKLDPSGNLLWCKTFGGTGGEAIYDVSIDNSANILLTGNFTSTVVDVNPGPAVNNLTLSGTNIPISDVFVLKFHSSGSYIWGEGMAGTLGVGMEVCSDDSNNVYVLSRARQLQPPGLSMVSCAYSLSCVVKLDISGNFKWIQHVEGDAYYTRSGGIDVDGNGDVFWSGSFSGNADVDPNEPEDFYATTSNGGSDIFIIKMNRDGYSLWNKVIGGSGGDHSYDLIIDANKNIYFTGVFTNTVDFDPGPLAHYLPSDPFDYGDAFVCQFDSSGNFVWVGGLSGTSAGGEEGITLCKDQLNNIYVGGRFNETVDFDPGAGTMNISTLYMDSPFTLKLAAPSMGIENTYLLDSKLYPNPSNGIVNITIAQPPSTPMSLELYDILGKLLITKNISTVNGTVTFELPLTKGIYTIRISSDLNSKTFKVIKE